jgi:hypothetical protein
MIKKSKVRMALSVVLSCAVIFTSSYIFSLEKTVQASEAKDERELALDNESEGMVPETEVDLSKTDVDEEKIIEEDKTPEVSNEENNQIEENVSNETIDNTENLKGIESRRILPAVFRLYNPNSGEHFFTNSDKERATLVAAGWRGEGMVWTDGPETVAEGGVPIYRLYNPNAGGHLYTTSIAERDKLIKAGWKNEGVRLHGVVPSMFYNETVSVRRLYNKNATGAQEPGSHHYTRSNPETDKLVKLGWKDEGIVWQVI